MHAQNRNDARRKKTERRVNDRREFDYEFGSPQWIEHVKQEYIAWPKNDRRVSSRRDGERRDLQKDNDNSDYTSDTLTEEEKEFFNHLFTED